MARLQVVLLVDELEVWGGTETHLLRLLPRLDPTRIETTLAVVGRCRLAETFRARGLRVEPLGIHRTFAVAGLRGVGKIAALLRRRRAGLLVTYHTASDLLGPLAGRFAGVPVLSSRRDEGFTKKPVHASAQRLVNPLLEGMIAVSHAVSAAVARREGYRGRVQIIWNGEDLERFRPGASSARSELGLPDEAVVLASVGSLTPIKDHATLLRAFEHVARAHPEARLLIVGDGSLRPQVEALARALAPGRVHLVGQREDVPDLLRAADIYIQASRSEGFSNAILQGMACGLPVVATAVGGNPELVTPECGTLAPPGDPVALGAALEPLFVDAERRRRMGRAARTRAVRSGSLEAMVSAYSDAFERAATGRFPGASSGQAVSDGAQRPVASLRPSG